MADEAMAVGVLILVFISGGLILFNMMHVGSFGLDLRIQGNFIAILEIIIARLVGLGMMIVSGWAIFNIVKRIM